MGWAEWAQQNGGWLVLATVILLPFAIGIMIEIGGWWTGLTRSRHSSDMTVHQYSRWVQDRRDLGERPS